MEQDQEKKQHVCKLCNKSFMSGRILGGHMRAHSVKDSVQEDENLEKNNMGNEGSYGLRDNPKKSWKSSVLNDDNCVFSVQDRVECRICGKQFESPRSLHGHMRHHSAEERSRICCKECGKWFKTVRSLTGHMRLHSLKSKLSQESRTSSMPNLVVINSKTVNLVRRKRSDRKRYKVFSPNASFSSLNEYESGFDIENEDEEVAMVLLMLSRGECELGEFKSVGESLDYDDSLSFEAKSLSESKGIASESFDAVSLSFEAKSLCGNKRIASNKNGADVFANDGDDDELVKKKKPRVEMFNSCSDCDCSMGIEKKKIQLELPIESFYQPVDSTRPEVDDESGLVMCDTEINKGIHDEVDTKSDSSQIYRDKIGLDLDTNPSNDADFDSCDSETINSGSDLDDSKKKSQFQCKICNKLFPTHQSLGGHQTLHRTRKSCATLKIDHCQASILPENTEIGKLDSVEEEENVMRDIENELKRRKKHKCLICFKFFASGQALGGHKRIHVVRFKDEQNTEIQQEVPDLCAAAAFDLNLPVMVDTMIANTEAGFKSCWPRSGYKHETLLDVVAT